MNVELGFNNIVSNIVLHNEKGCLVIAQDGDMVAIPLDWLDYFFHCVMETVDIPKTTKDQIMRKYRNKVRNTVAEDANG